jgi:hypothetical protein
MSDKSARAIVLALLGFAMVVLLAVVFTATVPRWKPIFTERGAWVLDRWTGKLYHRQSTGWELWRMPRH